MDELVLTRKIKLWENRLLDLSKRNRMISLKDSGFQVLRLIEPGFEELYKTLVIDGRSIPIMRPINKQNAVAVYSMMRLMHHLGEPLEIGQGKIRAAGTLENSLKVVKNLKKYAELSLQEKGTNVLYLSFGFLYWKDRDTTGAWLKAPLVLVPASLTQSGVELPYAVQKTEEEIIVNPTFAYYLETNYGIHLPQLKSTNQFEDVMAFLEQTSAAVEKLGWHVEQEVYLSTMSFLKTNMYNDLVANESRIIAHPIIRAFAGEQNQFTTLPEAATDFKHDATNVENVFEVLNADSSQKDAVELSRIGISFVMQGPPGTGKSQTIANIIAQGIAEGKKILFVSEKQAALDVVYRRLHDVGLSKLCLPLHDPKTSRQTVLREFEVNLDATGSLISNDSLAELHQLGDLREDLNAYAHSIHEKLQPLNMSLYEAYQMLFALSNVPDVVTSLPDVASVNRADMNRMIRQLSEYETVRNALGENWYTHPWLGVKKRNLSNAGKQRLKEAMESLLKRLDTFCSLEINKEKQLCDIITLHNRQAYESVGRLIAGVSLVPEHLVLEPITRDGASRREEMPSATADVAAFFRKTEQEILKNCNGYKTYCLETANLFREFSELLGRVKELNTQISYLEVFRVWELMHQFDLDVQKLSVTDQYFTPDGIESIHRIQAERSALFDCANTIRAQIQQRYREEILQLQLDIPETQLFEIFEQIRSIYAISAADLPQLLETEYGIRLANHCDAEELQGIVEALLNGEFDCFATLSENEFYFAYELLEEAGRREAANDRQWFVDYGPMLQQYFGQTQACAKSGAWEKYTMLANDFYYIKTAYPELLTLIHLTSVEKERIFRLLHNPRTADSSIHRIVTELQNARLTDTKITPDELCQDIQNIWEYQNIFARAESTYMETAAIVGNQYLMASTDWTLIRRNMEFVQEVAKIFDKNRLPGIQTLLVNAHQLDWGSIHKVLSNLVNAGRNVPVIETLPVGEGERILKEYARKLDIAKEHTAARDEVYQAASKIRNVVYRDGELLVDPDLLRLMLDSDSRKLFDLLDCLCALKQEDQNLELYLDAYEDPERLKELTIRSLRDLLQKCLEHFVDYDTMVEYQVCAEHCREDGLNPFIEKAYQLQPKGTLGKMFEKAFLTAWIDIASESKEIISTFSSRLHTSKINAFEKLDVAQLSIAKKRVNAIAQERMPNRNTGKVVGEMGILLREISKSRNGMTIRQLFNNIPKLLTELKPCLMMSPLSVAYFLNADLYQFDMVIFDEASQIFPENAISAILRGKQVIIAGDSKQMPPTGFFQSAMGVPEATEDEDMAIYGDSILEEAENVLPNLSLTWHYRSRNESLITFSNRNMYAGSLVTFPNNAPNQADTGVEYVYINDGIYEQRCNEAEAAACVALTIDHFRKHPQRSIGIIAFSVSQEECIERAFEAYRANNPHYESFFSSTRENPFFIKNLENVQGDERDTILLSVGYGRNAQGTLRYHFGPLGQQGGERRMNVAITRAKHNIKLVTSLKPEDFDKTRVETNAGAKLLYDYIQYAKTGPIAEGEAATDIVKDDFQEYIVKLLQEAGYQTRQGVGNSGYKVEIAVEDPQNPGSYIVGIETDGPGYDRVRTVRDRECLRPGMLKVMGWKMYRAWSTQWIRNPEAEKEKLLNFVANQMQTVP